MTTSDTLMAKLEQIEGGYICLVGASAPAIYTIASPTLALALLAITITNVSTEETENWLDANREAIHRCGYQHDLRRLYIGTGKIYR